MCIRDRYQRRVHGEKRTRIRIYQDKDSNYIINMIDTFASTITNFFIKELISQKIGQLAEAIAEFSSNSGKYLSQEVIIDEFNPLGLPVIQSIINLNKVIKTISSSYSSNNVLKLSIDENLAYSLQSLNLILGLPKLFEHIGNAFRIIKSFGIVLKCSEIEICVKQGDYLTENYWNWENFKLTISNNSSSQYIIPTEDQLVEAMLSKTEEGKIPIDTTDIHCTLANKEIMYPLITETGLYKYNFILYKTAPYKQIDVLESSILPFSSACLVPLTKMSSSPISISVNQEDKQIVLSVPLPELTGPIKLLLRIGSKIIFSQVLLCYSPTKVPKLLKPDINVIFANKHEAFFKPTGAYRMLLKNIPSVSLCNSDYFVYFWDRIEKFTALNLTENIIRLEFYEKNTSIKKPITELSLMLSFKGWMLPLTSTLLKKEEESLASGQARMDSAFPQHDDTKYELIKYFQGK
eukprot:TRINITY_DN4055_c0_g1_i14.p1 TRINITY_DN4055_c0_g1~~TRINITY_DN4055_c0_g1_i14.p1  ORF type:complete len:464 (-),score=68.33 TRINITY_DN4055_c0_g1_i14:221-1612(-)